jgi:hypothetical protein
MLSPKVSMAGGSALRQMTSVNPVTTIKTDVSRAAHLGTRLLALAAVVFFLLTAFRAGYLHDETDFPNYYTAAVAVSRGQQLHNFYDWTWFQRQMNYAGFERQLGAYTPQTPLTMLPFVELTRFAPQTAKRLWLVCNLIFLGATVWLLSRVTQFRREQIALVAFCGYGSLYMNFLYGQYYVFLLFLLTLAFYCLHQRRATAGGFIFGVVFGLKLYGGPFLIYFAAKRNWLAIAGMLTALVFAGLAAIAMFGWRDVLFYATQILPRSLEGGSVDPYHMGNPTISTLLRHTFMPEPELNPQPLWNSPWLFFFLRTLALFVLVLFTFLGLALHRAGNEKRDFAWFVILVLLLSTSVASYTFILPYSLVLLCCVLRCHPGLIPFSQRCGCCLGCISLRGVPPGGYFDRASWPLHPQSLYWLRLSMRIDTWFRMGTNPDSVLRELPWSKASCSHRIPLFPRLGSFIKRWQKIATF